MNRENLAKIHVIETKIVSLCAVASVTKKKGKQKMHREPTMLLKTNGERMPTFREPTILMKIRTLSPETHDVDEK
jgi:hypothetical protein